ncbi:MAG: ferritin family protein [Chloroflexi bacterium]|nr:ferritin family protein [Chloroflexota bacterium]
MAVFFKEGELYRIAAEMERSGLAFYSEVARQAKDESTKAVYAYLITSEKRHLRKFNSLFSHSAKSSNPESYKGEYRNYLAALLKDRVFSSSALARSRASKSSVRTALDTGIKAEKDSILFYAGLLDLVPEDNRTAIGMILAEEKRHLQRLMDYKYKSGCFK